MSEIDPNTGLPKLPEDYFWRITPHGVEIRKRLPDTDWEYIPAMYRNHQDCKVEVRWVDNPRMRKWNRLFYVFLQDDRIPETRYTNRSEVVVQSEYVPVLKRTIQGICEELLDALESRMMVGDYPPNKLGA